MSRSPVGGPAPFDPAKCDHGSEHAGRVEFEWCDNCDPFRARILQATGVDPGPNPLLPEPPTDGRTSSKGEPVIDFVAWRWKCELGKLCPEREQERGIDCPRPIGHVGVHGYPRVGMSWSGTMRPKVPAFVDELLLAGSARTQGSGTAVTVREQKGKR